MTKSSKSDTATLLRQLYNLFPDIALVLLNTEKSAFQKNWPKLRPSLTRCLRHLEEGGHVGVQPSSLGCVVLDSDDGDGPKAAQNWALERGALVCVTRSTSKDPKKAHVWCAMEPYTKAEVKNGRWRIEDRLDGVSAGDLRGSHGQVRLTDRSMRKLLNADFSTDQRLTINEVNTIFTSRSTPSAPKNIDPDEGHELTEETCPPEIMQRLMEPELPERFRELFCIVSGLSERRYSMSSVIETIGPYVRAWPGDGKFEGDELERHVRRAWKPPINLSDEFPDDIIEVAGVPAVRPTYESGLTVSNGRAPDTYANARSAIFAQGVSPAFNELNQSVSFTGHLPWPPTYGSELTEHTVRLTRDLLLEAYQSERYQPSKDHVQEAIMSIAYINKFNPVIDYLNGLEWDGKERCHKLFTIGFPCTDPRPYLREVGLRFLISAVARARDPGCKVDSMPVVCGRQGVGKSSGARALFGDDWFSDASLPDLRNKDAAIILRGTWCHEYAELAGMGMADVSTLKAFLSRQTDAYRPPYGKVSERHPRRCVFFGTVNEGGYLRDTTGGRRFWPLQLNDNAKVNIDWLTRLRDQLWAEADVRYSLDEEWWLEEEAWALAMERAAEETVEDPWADIIRAHLHDRPLDPREETDPDRISSFELFEALNLEASRAGRNDGRRLRLVMEQAIGGWRYKKIRFGEKTLNGYEREHSMSERP